MSKHDKGKLSIFNIISGKLLNPKVMNSTGQDRKGSKTAPIDSNFVSNKFKFKLI